MVNKEKMEEYFNFGVFLMAMILAFIAISSLYYAINALIGTWIPYEYKPIVDIAFNLSILIICVYLIRERLIKR